MLDRASWQEEELDKKEDIPASGHKVCQSFWHVQAKEKQVKEKEYFPFVQP